MTRSSRSPRLVQRLGTVQRLVHDLANAHGTPSVAVTDMIEHITAELEAVRRKLTKTEAEKTDNRRSKS